MTTLGSQGTFVSGVNGSVTFNGNVYAVAKTFTLQWGNKLDEEAVIGTDIPIINTNVYHGEFDMDILYSTENSSGQQFASLLTPANGQISPVSLVLTGKDVAGPTTRTFTLTSTCWPQQTELDFVGDDAVHAKIKGVLTARPAVT